MVASAMPLEVFVPASSANLGPGFDCLGLSVGLELRVRAEPGPQDRFHYQGEGHVPDTSDNLVHEGFRAVFARLGRPAPTLALHAHNPIPLARGLGSSSAALVAGALLADAVAEAGLGPDGVFQLAAELEGHPDNVAPALFGGLTVSSRGEDGRWLNRVLPWPPSWRLLFGVPEFEVHTEEARAVLPDRLTRQETVATASRVALWPLAVLQNDPELLRLASHDLLHEPHRLPLLPGFERTQHELRNVGAWAAYLSGAGPALGVITGADRVEACREVLARYAGDGGRVLEPSIGKGARVEGRLTAEPAAP